MDTIKLSVGHAYMLLRVHVHTQTCKLHAIN